MDQNFKNHTRLSTPYHFILLPLVLIFMAVAAYNFNKAMRADTGRIVAGLFLLGSVILFLLTWFCRKFALTAQDRAIRAEETLRYFSLTGKTFPKNLRLRQIIALRFAADEEFESLVNKSITEELSSSAIKKEIKNWRADNYRV